MPGERERERDIQCIEREREREREREKERDGEAMSSGGRANLLVQVRCLSLKSPLLPSPLSALG